MSEISEAAKVKACELANVARVGQYGSTAFNWRDMATNDPEIVAFARYIQDVSDAAKAVLSGLGEPLSYHEAHLAPFILADPVDPLEQAMRALEWCNTDMLAADLRTELTARGLKIVPVQL